MAHTFVYGKIQYVDNFPDYKVKVVKGFADLHVQEVKFPGKKPGEWQIVKHFGDYKVKKVQFGEDFTIKYVKHAPGVTRRLNYPVGIHSVGFIGKNMARFFGRQLGEAGIICNIEIKNIYEMKNLKLLILVINHSYNEWAGLHRKFVAEMLRTAKVLPIIIDESSRSPKSWDMSLKPASDRFYIDMVSETHKSFDMTDYRKVKELREKVGQLTGIIRKQFFITMRKEPTPTSYIQKNGPFLHRGFTDKEEGFGAGGMFEAFDTEVPGTIRIHVGRETFWVSTEKTHVNMLEWRLFKVEGDNERFLLTSDRSDTAPGWSIEQLFYAPGTPSLGDDQGLAVADGKNIRFHIFNSHNWGKNSSNHDFVLGLHKEFTSQSIISWVDEEQLNQIDTIPEQLRKGIYSSAITVVYLTEEYIEKCNSEDVMDNCRREFDIYKEAYETEGRQVIFAVVEHDKKIMADSTEWGILAPLAKECPVVSLENGSEALTTLIKEKLNLKPALYYITAVKSKSYVNKGAFYEENGYSKEGTCGAGGIFEAFEEAAPGLTKIEVEGATFYASKEKVSLAQLEWRCYQTEDRYLVTSQRTDMAPGWTFIISFYARGVPSTNSSQKQTLTVN